MRRIQTLAILREDCDDVSFGEVEVEAADVDVGRVAVVGVPGCVGGDDFFELALVEALDLLDLVHGGLRWRGAKGKKLVMTLWRLPDLDGM
jgi:hypothetical protein